MREKDSERGGEWVRGRTVRVGVFGGLSSQDLDSHRIQIRNSLVSIATSNGLFESYFRLGVSKGVSFHFVLMEKSALRWLKEVIQVAADNKWVFSKVSETISKRRTIFVSRLWVRDRLGETCFEELDEVGTKRPLAISSSRSFAKVTEGPTFSEVGLCSRFCLGDAAGVKVVDLGVKERLNFLETCLVFRFSSVDRIDWKAFRLSKEKVLKIKALNRCRFGSVVILLDEWIPEAGRSNVSFEEDVVWVTISGIPLQLRSSELFKELGDLCGDFLSYDDRCSLSSVRLKIRLRGSVPEDIPLLFEDVIFPLKMVQDPFIPARSCGFDVKGGRMGRMKGKALAFPKLSVGEVSEWAPSGSDFGLTSIAQLDSEILAETRPRWAIPAAPEVAVVNLEKSGEKEKFGVSPDVSVLQGDAQSDRGERCLKKVASTSKERKGIFVGLKLSQNGCLRVDFDSSLKVCLGSTHIADWGGPYGLMFSSHLGLGKEERTSSLEGFTSKVFGSLDSVSASLPPKLSSAHLAAQVVSGWTFRHRTPISSLLLSDTEASSSVSLTSGGSSEEVLLDGGGSNFKPNWLVRSAAAESHNSG
ncbi:hypothetical protein LINPERHAP2_LOCUS25521 [Linum perenne]